MGWFLELSDPYTGGIHDDGRPDGDPSPAHFVEHPRATDASPLPDQFLDRGVVRHKDPGARRRLHDTQDETRVRGDGVRVRRGANEPSGVESRLPAQSLLACEPAPPREDLVPRDGIVQPEADPELPALRPPVSIDGDEERDGLHEVGDEAREDVPFAGGLADETEAELL